MGAGVDLAGVDNGPLVIVGMLSLSLSFLLVVDRWKSPGCPVIGVSSIYSSPYLSDIWSVSSSRRLLR